MNHANKNVDNLKMFLMHNISDACADWFEGTVMTVIVWKLDLQLPMQSVPITTDVVGSNLHQGEWHNAMW